MLKKSLAMLCILAMAASFFMGCAGQQAAAPGEPADTSATTASTDTAETTMQETPADATGESVAASLGLSPDKPITFELWNDNTWWGYNANWTGIIPEEITARTGVTLAQTVAVDSKQLGVMIAAGTLPDIVFVDMGNGMPDELSSSDVCYAFNELIEEYNIPWEVSDTLKNLALLVSQEADEGNYFTVPAFFNTTEEYQSAFKQYNAFPAAMGTMSYRYDLYEAMGKPKMETVEDFLNVLRQAKETYPDLLPLRWTQKQEYTAHAVKQWFGLGNNMQFVQDRDKGDAIVFKANHSNYKDFLKFKWTCFNEGLSNPDNLAWDTTVVPNSFATTTIFTSLIKDQTTMRTQEPDAVLYTTPQFNADKNYPCVEQNRGVFGCFISRNCKDPEAAIRFLAYMFSDEGSRLSQWGREGIDYTFSESGAPVWSEEWKTIVNAGEKNEKLNTGYYLGGNRINESVEICSQFENYDLFGDWEYKQTHLENQWWVIAARPMPGTDMRIKYDAIVDYVDNGAEAKVVLSANEAEFEANYAEMMQTIEELDVAEVEAYLNERAKELRS